MISRPDDTVAHLERETRKIVERTTYANGSFDRIWPMMPQASQGEHRRPPGINQRCLMPVLHSSYLPRFQDPIN